MSEAYREGLQREIHAWKAVQEALRRQRRAIVDRDTNTIQQLQGELEELLRETALCHGATLDLQGAQHDPATAAVALETELRQTQRDVQSALRLNHELLRDICSYLEMIREVVVPGSRPQTYGRPQGPQGPSAIIGKVA